jgi:hypothetical protein
VKHRDYADMSAGIQPHSRVDPERSPFKAKPLVTT